MAFCLDRVVETELRGIAGNNVCVDCDGRGPQWASVSFGIFMCLECSGRHRSLGVHISFVRSVAMDSWTEKQINIMRCGGNAKFLDFLNQYSIPKNTPIARKYSLPAATLYKDRLLAEVEGRPLPTELPKDLTSTSGGDDSTSVTPGGTDTLPGETEEEYVTRQKKLQAEAKERLRAKFGSNAGTGLNARGGGGAMQGIGSDASYRPGGGSNSAADATAEVTAQVVDGAQKALSLLASSWTLLGESVSKSVTAATANTNTTAAGADSGGKNSNNYINNTNSFSNGNSSSNFNNINYDRSSSSSSATDTTATAAPLISPETIDVYKQNIVVGWSALATGAVGLWSKSLEVVQTITAPVDDDTDFKFSRGTYTAAQEDNNNNDNTNNNSVSSSQQQLFTGERSNSNTTSNPTLISIINNNNGNSSSRNNYDNNNNNYNLSSNLNNSSFDSSNKSSSNQNINALSSMSSLAPIVTEATAPKKTVTTPAAKPIKPTITNATKAAPAAPVGDDFFATFGV